MAPILAPWPRPRGPARPAQQERGGRPRARPRGRAWPRSRSCTPSPPPRRRRARRPSLAHGDTRDAVRRCSIAVPVVAWLAGRLPPPGRLALEALLAAAALSGACRGYGSSACAARSSPRPAWPRSPRPRGCSGACARGASSSARPPSRRCSRARRRPPHRGSDRRRALPRHRSRRRHALRVPRTASASAWRATGRSAACRRSGRPSGRGSATTSSTSAVRRRFLTPYRSAASFQEALRHGGFDAL